MAQADIVSPEMSIPSPSFLDQAIEPILIPELEKMISGGTIEVAQHNETHKPNGSCGDTIGNNGLQNGTHEKTGKNGELNVKSFHVESFEISNTAPPAIAIVGIGLRLPGNIHSTEAFWDLLVNKRETRCIVPKSRYNIDGFYNPSKQPGSVASQYGHFLAESDSLDAFDTSFFTMSKAEAEQLDPQQRMVLEVVWECMENGGQTNWRGKNIGVFLGTFNEDWHDLLAKDTQSSGLHKIVSSDDFVVANRISYDYNLKGPSLTIKTACSSAMIGIHEACQSIYNGDCESAIIAGTNLIITPTMTITMSEQGILSQEGRCKTFDAKADGYSRGEAINAIYIKKLTDAIANNDPIRGIIRGTAMNSDGKTPGITMPSTDAHERLIRRAYEVAQISDLSQTAFFECHGTGTSVGDPLEANAVARVFGEEKGIFMGSVKTNVGHSEASSGLTSIIKSVLSLEHRIILPNINFSQPNPKIPFKKANLRVPLEPTAWPNSTSERISVNSFGIAGSNAHVILDSAASFGIERNSYTNGYSRSKPNLLVFSATNPVSLDKSAQALQAYFKAGPARIRDIAYTLGVRRDHLPHRSFCISRGTEIYDLSPATKAKVAPHVTFVFTGQGAQWGGMGKELMQDFPSFNADIIEMTNVLENLQHPPSWNLREELLKDSLTTNLSKAEFSQPLCTALQVALVNLLTSLNILPSSVVGHSSGEISASYAAGAVTQEEAILIAYYRGQATKSSTRKGSMAAVGMGRTEVSLYLKRGVSIGCENSQSSVTLTGETKTLEEVLAEIKEDEPDVFARLLNVEMAYHSHHMKDVGSDYEEILSSAISSTSPAIPFYSSVTGKLATQATSFGPSYWRQNLESPVLFHSAIQASLFSQPKDHLFLEVGPHSALAGPIRQIFTDQDSKADLSYLPTLMRGKDCTESILKAVGQLHLQSIPVDFNFLTPIGNVLTDLPLYQWQHDNVYWNEGRLTQDWRFRKHKRHELLGSRTLESTDIEPSWRNILKIEDVPWLADHKIIEDVVFPCAGYVSMAGEGMRQLSGASDYSIRSLTLLSALVLVDSRSVEIITNFRPIPVISSTDAKWYEFTVFSYQSSWTKHCTGQVRSGLEKIPPVRIIENLPRKMMNPYKPLKNVGLNYGPKFQGLTEVSALPGKTTAVASISRTMGSETYYPLHPTTIDHCLQVIAVAMSDGLDRHMNKLCVPTGIELLCVTAHEIDGTMKASASAVSSSSSVSTGTVVLMTDDKVVLSLIGGKLSPVDNSTSHDSNRAGATELEWAKDIDLTTLDTLIHPVSKFPGSFDAVHRLTLLVALELGSQTPFMTVSTDYLQKFCAFLNDYVVQASEESLLHFKDVDVKSLISLEPKARRELITLTRSQIANTEYDAIGELIFRVLDNGKGILEGSTKTIEVLIREDALTKVYNVLGDMVDCGGFFAAAGHSNPNLRILEIGAGTGGTSAICLRNLVSSYGEPMYSKYSYTDISPGFFPTAKERFKDYPNIQYQILDITRDPIEQGFEEGSYDLVVAANVLHATPNLVATLSNVRKLLSPRGRLFLQELNPGSAQFIDLIMGGLRDWWLGAEDGRVDKPYVDITRWDEDLRKAGFAGVEGVVYDDAPPNILANIVARPIHLVEDFRRVTLLHGSNSNSPTSVEVEKLLVVQGYTVTNCTLKDELPAYQDIISLIDLESPLFKSIQPEDFNLFMALLPKLDSAGVLWVTRSAQMDCVDPYHAIIVGLSRTIRSELSIPFVTLELDDTGEVGSDAVVKVFQKFQSREENGILAPEAEYALKEGIINVPRYHWISLDKELSTTSAAESSLHLDIERLGQISSLQWIAHSPEKIESGQLLVKVQSVGLNTQVSDSSQNFHSAGDLHHANVAICAEIVQDLDTASGINHSHCGFGLEASGVIEALGTDVENFTVGDRVMLLGSGLFSTTTIISAKRCIKIPDNVSFRDASGIPFAFATALYALQTQGRLSKGETVLIHDATDNIGLAAIQICKYLGANIYATTSSIIKADFLVESLGISRGNVFDSLNSTFYENLIRETAGRGVDLVLNSLTGHLMTTSWECVADNGRMVDVANRDASHRGSTGLDLFEKNRSLFSVNINTLPTDRLHTLLNETAGLIAQGVLVPLHSAGIFSGSSVVEAFVNAQQQNIIGKTIINIPQEKIELPVAPVPPQLRLRSDVSYLLVGGLGAVGKAISTWMVECGARHLIYLARSAGKSAEDREFFVELATQGCTVEVISGNVTNIDDVRNAVQLASKPIAGVIQMAMVLNDALLTEMTHDQWQGTLAPRVQGTWNLHKATFDLPLDFFILMSSIAGAIGSRGQGNYAASNTFLDAFAQYRRGLGLTAFVMDIGTTAGIGLIGSSNTVDAILQSQSFWFTTEADIIAGLHLAILRSSQPATTNEGANSFVFKNHITLGLRSSRLLSDEKNRVAWKRDIRMSIARNMDGSTGTSVEVNKNGELETLLSSIDSDSSVIDDKTTIEILTRNIGKRVYVLMLQSEDELDVHQSLESLGVDSLVTIEIRTWWRRTMGFEVSTLEILNANTIKGLGELAIAGLRGKAKKSGGQGN